MLKRTLKYTAFVLGSFVGAVVVIVVVAAVIGMAYDRFKDPTFVNEETDFINNLTIPPLLEPSEVKGTKVFSIKLQKGTTELFQGAQTETWGAPTAHL
jgi:hypothetical protein